MASKAQLPVLPHGSPSTLSGLSESFSFHASPEAFIASRVLAFRSSNPSLAESRMPIRAKVLNRNVAVISSHYHIQQILDNVPGDDCSFSAGKAYDELMAPFFQPPNLLLSDPPLQLPMKEVWKNRMKPVVDSCMIKCHQITLAHLRQIESGSSIDIYQSMKALAWKLILPTFLTNDSKSSVTDLEREEYVKIERLQETLLRGQFSLFPVSINAKIWRSPRSKGLQARKELQSLLRNRMQKPTDKCPFLVRTVIEQEDVANHLLLFTSSLAAKALASLLTALLLNLYVYRGYDASKSTLADKLITPMSEVERDARLRSICLETERLSPPVVGIMRQTTRDVVLEPHEAEAEHRTLIPKGWDTWLYFVAAARDPAVFGSSAEKFTPERYCEFLSSQTEAKRGFAFGAGAKSCLGEHLVQKMAMTVAKTCLGIFPGIKDQDTFFLEANADSIPLGVQAWLGWQSDIEPEQWAKDMKQLPTQRPTKAVKLRILRDSVEAESSDQSDVEWSDALEFLE